MSRTISSECLECTHFDANLEICDLPENVECGREKLIYIEGKNVK